MSTADLFLTLVLVTFYYVSVNGSEIPPERRVKSLSPFNIIRFSNSPCSGTGNKNGTCYTDAECTARRGDAAGNCASGFGVCCTFSVTCGQTSSENCTYFESSELTTRACRLKICKIDGNVCQLRLDFDTFVIEGPSTATATVAETVDGLTVSGGLRPVTPATQCVIDRFSVTNPGKDAPPTICGTNTGEHMYVDASDACNELAFQLGSTVNRQWSIKITQYSCNYDNLAPDGCTQYYFGDTEGVFKTYNFDGGAHLANQQQKICVRQERGNCQICYFPVVETDFIISGRTAIERGYTSRSACCGYGTSGLGINGYDCLIIPGALKQNQVEQVSGSHFCGRKLISNQLMSEDNKTICTTQRPFHLSFLSDNYEFDLEAREMINKGFRLAYTQKIC